MKKHRLNPLLAPFKNLFRATHTYHNIREGRGRWHTRCDQFHILQPGQQTLQQQSSHVLTCALKAMRNFWRETEIYKYIYMIYIVYIIIECLHLPENMDMVNSGRNCANCLDRKRCERQYALLSRTSSVPTLLSSSEKEVHKRDDDWIQLNFV